MQERCLSGWLPNRYGSCPLPTDLSPYLKEWEQKLRAAGVRVSLDNRSEKIGYKIREARSERIPYMAVAGDNETENYTLSVRKRGTGDLGEINGEEFL